MTPNRADILAGKKAYYERNKARILATQKAKREANKERFYAHRRQLYSSERDKRRAEARARYAADPKHAARVRANNRKYRAARLDEFRARDLKYAKVYQEKDRDRFVSKCRRAGGKRRALEFGAFVEAVDSATVFRRDRGVCGICHRKVDSRSKWHIDHVIPLSRGGVHSYDNVQLAHARCNLSKRDTLPSGQLRLLQMLVLGGAK